MEVTENMARQFADIQETSQKQIEGLVDPVFQRFQAFFHGFRLKNRQKTPKINKNQPISSCFG